MEDRHDDEDDEPTCHLCGGPLYRAPQWDYYQCDDCGKIEKMEREEP
jgi:tRNA(Ile2) C34 agmatinyltransferase TiaS